MAVTSDVKAEKVGNREATSVTEAATETANAACGCEGVYGGEKRDSLMGRERRRGLFGLFTRRVAM